jgi:hypothetical protein
MTKYLAQFVMLRCVNCGKFTSPLEAYQRVFNAGRCACAGSFTVASISGGAGMILESATSLDAVDPSVADPGTPTTRD